MLAYDFQRLFIDYGSEDRAGRAVIERDQGQTDAFGGDTLPDWQPLSTVQCVVAWNKAEGSRSTSRTYVTPTRRVAESAGFLIVPLGTDVTEDDRISQIQDNAGNVLIDGLFTITAVLDQGTHTEVYISRAHLGG